MAIIRIKGKGKVVPAMKAYWWGEGIDPLIL
jgi:hypothetical protein